MAIDIKKMLEKKKQLDSPQGGGNGGVLAVHHKSIAKGFASSLRRRTEQQPNEGREEGNALLKLLPGYRSHRR